MSQLMRRSLFEGKITAKIDPIKAILSVLIFGSIGVFFSGFLVTYTPLEAARQPVVLVVSVLGAALGYLIAKMYPNSFS